MGKIVEIIWEVVLILALFGTALILRLDKKKIEKENANESTEEAS